MTTTLGKCHALTLEYYPLAFQSTCENTGEKLSGTRKYYSLKTLEQNPWFLSFSVFELVVVAASGRADAKSSNFEFN